MSSPEPEVSEPIADGIEKVEDSPSTLSPVPEDAWYRDLPPDYHVVDHVRNHDNLESFVRDSINAQRLIGRKGIIQPDENSTIEDWGNYYESLGRPSGLESYDSSEWVERPDDNIPRDENFEQKMLKELYDSGVSEKQAQRLWNFYLEGTADQFNQQMSKHIDLGKELDAKLTDTYGQDRDVKLSYARKAWAELGGKIGARSDEWLGFLEQPMANGQRRGDQWPLIQAFVALGESTQESAIKGGKFDGVMDTRAVPPASAREELARKMADPEFIKVWSDQNESGHDRAVDEISRLHELIYGE